MGGEIPAGFWARVQLAQRRPRPAVRRRGAIAVSAPLSGIRVVRCADKLTLYQWGTRTAKHYFCSVCGIYTHHQRRSNPQEFGVNVAILEGVNPRDLGEVPWADGVNHPADRERLA